MQACWPSRDRRDALPATFKNGACSRLRNRYRVTSAAPRRSIIIARLVGKLNHALDRSEKLLSEGVTALLRALWANARSYSECRAQCDNQSESASSTPTTKASTDQSVAHGPRHGR